MVRPTSKTARVILTLLLVVSSPLTSAAEPGDWHGVRWGMTPDEVVAARPGLATKLPEPVTLADGNVIAAEATDEQIAGFSFRVAFVFDPARKLALVSLKSDPTRTLKPVDFDAIRKVVAERQGGPGTYSSDDNFIDMRQETWKTPRTRVDVKYIPGTVVVMYSAAQPEVPPLLKRL